MQRPEDKRTALVMRAPNADLARDPRWGRTEESYGEDAFLTARLTVANIKGLQGDNPRYWRTAALMKHFLANSNEDRRDSTSSNFDMRLFYEYYAYPSTKALPKAKPCFYGCYNGWNGPAMCVHPCLKEITRDKWGNNGIIWHGWRSTEAASQCPPCLSHYGRRSGCGGKGYYRTILGCL